MMPVGVAAGAKRPGPAPAGVTLTGGCRGQATSRQPKGKVSDTAIGPGAVGASPSHPFDVARGGTISWSGQTPVPFSDPTWWVHIDGLPALSGGSVNASHATSAAGVLDVGSYLPTWLGLTGRYYVNGQIGGVGGTCAGALYLSLTGDPATGIAMWAGIVFVLLGFALVLGARPNWYARFRVLPTGSVVATRVPPRPATTMPTGSVVKTRVVPKAPTSSSSAGGGATAAPTPPSPGTGGSGS